MEPNNNDDTNLPTNLEDALNCIKSLRETNSHLEAKNHALSVRIAFLQKKNTAVQANLGAPSHHRAAELVLSSTKPTEKFVDDGKTQLSRSQLQQIIKLTFDNTTAADVKHFVLGHPLLSQKVTGLVRALCTSAERGISEDEVEDRQRKFGKNEIPMEPQTSILVLMWEALQDPTLIFLCFAAIVSLVIGVFVEKDPMGWLEGTAILTAVVVVVLVGSINDYQKESQFRSLNAKKDDMTVTVVRDGQKKEMSCHNLVVGDILLLGTGDIVTCDGYAIGPNDLQINEKMLTGETVNKRKGEYEIDGDRVVKSPVLFAGTQVQDGQGKVLVLAVGTATYQGTMQQKMDEADAEHSRSILQQKLDDMTSYITNAGAAFAVVTVLILCFRMYIGFHQGLCCKESWDHAVHWSELLSFLISGVTIFVVAVPEGLPLAVTIALAFSVKKMLKDQNLVRHLTACETMGGATTICSDKTGTLTTSKMTVVKVFCDGSVSTMESLKLSPILKKLLCDAAVVNTMSKTNLRASSKGKEPDYLGNDTECGLLVMANKLGANGKAIDYDSEDQEYKRIRREFPEDMEGRKQFTFSSDRKRMSTRVKIGPGKYRVFCKGAAEMVVELCTNKYNMDGSVEPMSDKARKEVEAVINQFADEALRTICLAVKDVNVEIDDVEEAEKNLTMIGLVGIEDPVREEVPLAIKRCREAGIIVRMVTGDNMKTAAAIAKKCGIIDKEEEGNVIDGKTFRERVAPGDVLDQHEFDKVWPKLRVMGRSTPLDKHLLVSGIQASKIGVSQTVAVTGDGTNDAPALKKADVGFAMGVQGTDVAKNASDIIIMDDNFASIVKAVMWGRCVYDNICRFLQFQLTVNITAIVVACVGSAVLTSSPLTAIQMLWVNLIMDSFASLALATEDPSERLLQRKPYPRNRAVLSKIMMKNMILHALWQLVILAVLIFAVGDVCQPHQQLCDCSKSLLSDLTGYWGSKPFHVPSGRPKSYDFASTAAAGACPPVFDPADKKTFEKKRGKVVPLRSPEYCHHSKGSASDTTQHYTMIFNVFVLMQLFNEINSRKIHNEWNVFSGIFNNYLFIFIVLGTMAAQVALIEVPGLNTAFGCQSLTPDQWLVCVLLGFSTIPFNFIVRLVPSELFPGS